MMPFADAQAAVIAACAPGASETIALHACAGRILARDVVAFDDLVPFARSAMDGYAIRSCDALRFPVTLPIAASVYAAPGTRHQVPGTATPIATGAAVPAGADCVIPFEHVDVREGSVTLTSPVLPGSYIFPPGDDARRGDILLARGTSVTPACVGLLAAAGVVHVDVYRQPRVAIICGGDELVGIADVPGHGQVRDSNGLMLAASLTAAGAHVIAPIRIDDDHQSVRTALLAAFGHADLIVTTGGASVGERDFIKAACDEIGVAFLFRSVALRPAKPTAFGRRGEALIAVLPGNPAAAFVACLEFVLPAIRALCGYADVRLARLSATLAGSIHAKPGRTFAAFAALAPGRDGFIATPLENQCSSLTRTAADAAAFIIVPPGPRTYEPGDRVDVDVFDWGRIAFRPTPSKSPLAALV